MLKSLSNLFADLTKPTADETISEVDLRLISGALMTEVILADGGTGEEEISALRDILTADFRFKRAEVESLIDHSRQKVKNSKSLFEFTDVVNEHFDQDEKFRLVQQLWKIAQADGVVHKLEEATIRKVADLIYLSHSAFIRAKLTASDGV